LIRRGTLAVLSVVSLAVGASAQISLRGGGTLDDAPTGFTPQGVVTTPRLAAGTVERVIPWDMVRAVGGPRAAEAAPFTELADMSWRARARWQRGDYAMAEPLLAELFEKKSSEQGPLTLRIAEGLLRCRLVRGDQTGAVLPWLTSLRLQGADAGLPSEADPRSRRGASTVAEAAKALAAVIDPETGLCPALPPIWTNTEDTAALAASLGDFLGADTNAEAPHGVRELARLYARSAALDSQSPISNTPAEKPSQTQTAAEEFDGPGAVGVKLVSLIVRSRDPDPAVRRAAQSRLASGLSADADTWREAWRRAALGRSLLMESDEASKSEGLVHLLHLPARFKPTQPYLSGLAVIDASAELKRRGVSGASAATRLIADLKLEEPFHPALRAIASELPISNPAGAKP
jgi:hypothetical protein